MSTPIRMRYDTEEWPFRKLVEGILETPDLEGIHDKLELQQAGKDQATPFHRKFYARNAEFLELYRRFVGEYVNAAGEDILYQRVPTFRIHLPDNLAVGAWHRDTEYGHNPKELNFWVPVTPARDTSTIHFEKLGPINLEYGEVLAFSGALLHGNEINKTGKARVSFDFRTLNRRDFVDTDQKTATGYTRFKIGEYWSEL